MSGYFDQHRKRLQELTAELEALEREALIREPGAALVQYVDKNALRNRYFGVADRELRRALIAKYQQVMEEHRQRYPASIADTKLRIVEARKKQDAAPWTIPAAFAATAVFAAYYSWGAVGAVPAAIVSFVLAQRYFSRRRLHFVEELRLAQEELQTEEQGWNEQLQDPASASVFSQAEQQSGLADPQ